jgi:hypothetical protein
MKKHLIRCWTVFEIFVKQYNDAIYLTDVEELKQMINKETQNPDLLDNRSANYEAICQDVISFAEKLKSLIK